jgi:hypothetical protein
MPFLGISNYVILSPQKAKREEGGEIGRLGEKLFEKEEEKKKVATTTSETINPRNAMPKL